MWILDKPFGTTSICFIADRRQTVESTETNMKSYFKGNYDYRKPERCLEMEDSGVMKREKDAEKSWKIFTQCISRVIESTFNNAFRNRKPWANRQVQKNRLVNTKTQKQLVLEATEEAMKNEGKKAAREKETLTQFQTYYMHNRNTVDHQQ